MLARVQPPAAQAADTRCRAAEPAMPAPVSTRPATPATAVSVDSREVAACGPAAQKRVVGRQSQEADSTFSERRSACRRRAGQDHSRSPAQS